MNPQQNTQVARRWFEEVWNERRRESVHELAHPESVGHMEHADVRKREDFLDFQAMFLNAFPDLRVVVEDTAAEGENVVVRWFFSDNGPANRTMEDISLIQPALNSVPEPSTLILLSIGTAALIGFSRRRKIGGANPV